MLECWNKHVNSCNGELHSIKRKSVDGAPYILFSRWLFCDWSEDDRFNCCCAWLLIMYFLFPSLQSAVWAIANTIFRLPCNSRWKLKIANGFYLNPTRASIFLSFNVTVLFSLTPPHFTLLSASPKLVHHISFIKRAEAKVIM